MKTKFSRFLTLVLVFLAHLSFAQEKTISGTVTDDSGLTIENVTVLEKNTSNKTTTDFNGYYQIKIKEGGILVFSFLGYKSKEVIVGSSTNIDIKLELDINALDEVVVTTFGKTKQKRSLGYAATTISNEEIMKSSTLNPFENLSGKIAGVDITSPNQPGASTKVILRGYSGLNGSGPLYVIDGVPISSASNSGSNNSTPSNTDFDRTFDGGTNINDLDAYSIENVNILKGGAATALYGSRAANGAIIITTKKGKTEKIKIEMNSSVDFLEIARVPHNQTRWGQGWSGLNYSGLPNGNLGASNENGSWGPLFDGRVRQWGQIINNSQQIKPYSALENNVKDLYDIGNSYINSVRLSSGNDKSDFSFIFKNIDTDGIIPTKADAIKRNTLNLNVGKSINNFKIRVIGNYAQTRQNAINTGQSDKSGEGETFMQELLQIPSDISIIDLANYQNNPFNSNDYYYTPYSINPFWVINENATNIAKERFFGNINISYTFLPNLIGTLMAGTDIINGKRHSHGAVINYTPGSANDLLGRTPNPGGVTETTNQTKRYETFFTLDYKTKINDLFNLEAQVGTDMRNAYDSNLFASITNLNIPNYYEISNSALAPITDQQDYHSKGYSLFSAVTLSYLNKIYLNLTGRNEWVSTLPINNNSFFYPSINISGIILDTEKHFLKLRTGYASLANSAPLYSTESSVVKGSAKGYLGNIDFPFNNLNSFEIARKLGNQNIKPEFTNEFEIGLEANLFKNRITGDIAYYTKKTDGAIIELYLPSSTGYGSIVGNYLDLKNSGVEIALGFKPIVNKNFSWDFNYTFTKNQNEVTSLPEGVDNVLINSAYNITYKAVKGKPLGVFYGHTELKNDAGQIVVNPNTGIPLQTTDEQELGNSQRDFIMGFQNNFKYKNFRLSFSLDWKKGGLMYSYTSNISNFIGNSIITAYNERQPFIVPNSVIKNSDGTYSENTTPIKYNDISGYYNSENNPSIESEEHVIDKTFFRFRELSLNYEFPHKIINKTGLDKLSIYIYSKNLMLWTPNDNPYVDPEVTTFPGNDISTEFGEFAANPTQRTYGVGINISF